MDSTRLFSGACLLCRKGKSIHVSAEAQARTILFSFFILTFQTIFNKTRWIVEERAGEREREREKEEQIRTIHVPELEVLLACFSFLFWLVLLIHIP
jgi:hypothetical protein